MATAHQQLGEQGENVVCERIICPQCHQPRHTLQRLIANFECVDVICQFCGFLAQVKTTRVKNNNIKLPKNILGGAWRPQHERVIANIFHAFYIVGIDEQEQLRYIDYIPAHIIASCPEVYQPRKPLSPTAKRAGWQGFMFCTDRLPASGISRVFEN